MSPWLIICWYLLSCLNPIASYRAVWTHYEDPSPFIDLLFGTAPAYVDKSLLIKEYEEHSGEGIIISRPSGWGKTTGLDMLKRFYEIEIDAKKDEPIPLEDRMNRVLFTGGRITHRVTNVSSSASRTTTVLKPLAISRYPTNMRQQGQHPVVSLDASQIIGRNYTEIEDSLRRLVMRLFERHRYLEGRLRKDPHKPMKKLYQSCQMGENDEAVLGVCLQLLVWRVADYFDKPVHVFVDQYDAPLSALLIRLLNGKVHDADGKVNDADGKVNDIKSKVNDADGKVNDIKSKVDSANNTVGETNKAKNITEAMETEDFRQTVKLLARFYSCALKRNPFVKKSLLASAYPMANPILKLPADRFDHYTVLDSRFGDYFGFSGEEINSVTKNFSTNPDLTRKRYGGYAITGRIEDRYSMSPVINAMYRDEKIKQDITNDTNEEFIDYLLSRDRFQSKMQEILMKRNVSFAMDNVTGWKRFTYQSLDGQETVFAFLLHAGYLTTTGCNGSQLIVPNADVEETYIDRINRWRRNRYHPDYRDDVQLGEKMKTIVTVSKGDDKSIDEFRNFLREFFFEKNTTDRRFYGLPVGKDELDYARTVFVMALPLLRQKYRLLTEVEFSSGPDIVILPPPKTARNRTAVVLRIRATDQNDGLEGKAEESLKGIDARYYESTLFNDASNSELEKVVLVGLAFSPTNLALATEVVAVGRNR